MVIRRADMRSETRERMRGGLGAVEITHLVEQLPHGRLLADLTIPPGGSIGEHPHEAETEYYMIRSGAGVVTDNGVEVTVGPGDVVVTGGGASHSIRALEGSALLLTALIITD